MSKSWKAPLWECRLSVKLESQTWGASSLACCCHALSGTASGWASVEKKTQFKMQSLFFCCTGTLSVFSLWDVVGWESPCVQSPCCGLVSSLCSLQLCPKHKINIHREAARKQLTWKHVFQLMQSFVGKTVWFRFLSQSFKFPVHGVPVRCKLKLKE